MTQAIYSITDSEMLANVADIYNDPGIGSASNGVSAGDWNPAPEATPAPVNNGPDFSP